MKTWIAIICLLLCPSLVFAEANETTQPQLSDQHQSQSTEPVIPGELFSTAAITSKLPLDIQAKGTDACGTLLSYKIKEELMGSKLFFLSVANKKKFVLLLQTRPEFAERPNIASQYTIALVYQEDTGILSYYLDQMQGQVHNEDVAIELQKILEWTYATVKRYTYLLEE
ncbi:MAG: hypothetical protein GX043_05185 [Desulfovibrionales bacterium]|nr:hypothetical protein [Desulfovibrionales bacterium]